jgi:hypothetical protein
VSTYFRTRQIKQIIYIDNKRLMILQSNSADILSDTLKKSAEIHVSPQNQCPIFDHASAVLQE